MRHSNNRTPLLAVAEAETADTAAATNLFKLLNKYQSEEKSTKKARLAAAAGGASGSKPYFVKCGINHVTKLIEQKKAKLVVIAHDVEPIEVRAATASMWCLF